MISSSSSPRTPISPSSRLVPNLSTPPSPIRHVVTAETPSPPPAPKKPRHAEHTIEAVCRLLDIETIIEIYQIVLQELLSKVNTKEALEEERKNKVRILMSLR